VAKLGIYCCGYRLRSQAAVIAGLIEMTLPDKPKSRRQQYRLTAADTSYKKQWQVGKK